jgi:hypothetical protein
MSKRDGYGEAGQVRSGWRRKPDGTWEPLLDSETPRGKAKVNLKGLDESLEASHRRMARALAVETVRLEKAGETGALSVLDIEVLGKLSQTWRTLVQNEPTADYSDLTDEQIKAKLAEVKRR